MNRIPPETRQRIVELLEKGFSIRGAASLTGVAKQTVNTISMALNDAPDWDTPGELISILVYPDCRERAALLRAAKFLKANDEPRLASWLLSCKPEHAKHVATGVAAHALRRVSNGVEEGRHAWDILAQAELLLQPQADDWFFDGNLPCGTFEWEPDPAWLYSTNPIPRRSGAADE